MKKYFILGILFFCLFFAFPFLKKIEESLESKVVKKIAKGLPTWAKRQIQEDLLPYNSIKKSDLEAIYRLNKDPNEQKMIFCKIHNHQLEFQTNNSQHQRTLVVLRNLQKLASMIALPDCAFLISLQDAAEEVLLPEGNAGPFFSFAKKIDSKAILMPDFEALDGYDIASGAKQNIIKSILKAHKDHLWEKKIEKLFWRGAATGGKYTMQNWEKIPRGQLVLLSEKHPALIDARFQNLIQCNDDVKELLLLKKLVNGQFVHPKEHLVYKYLMDVDGNSCSYSRVAWILFSNSLLIKPKSKNVQWYYGGIKGGGHFVQVESDLSDLIDKLKWMQENDESCKKISENANAFAKEHLTQEANFAYLYYLIQEYAKRYKEEI